MSSLTPNCIAKLHSECTGLNPDPGISGTEQKAPRQTHTHTVYHVTVRAQDYEMGKDSLFHKWCWGPWIAPCEQVELDHYPTRKNELKTMKDLHVTLDTVKLLEGNIDSKLQRSQR